MDLDLDDLDGSTHAPPPRPTRFAPKFKPRPKSEPAPPPQTQSNVLDSTPPIKKEVLDSKPPLDSAAKIDNEGFPPLSSTATANGVVDMDVEAKPESQEPNVNNDGMEIESGEDEVVREIDVYFSPSTDSNTQMYVLQYPLRPMWRPYELDERCNQVRVKPATAEVEVDLELDVDSKNYDPDADFRVRMTKQTLSSSWKPTCTTSHYAVGVLMGNKLHLNPIHAVVQLRPSMQHLKPGDSKKKHNLTSNVEDRTELEELVEEKPVGPSRKQNKPPPVVSSDRNKDIGECWVPLKYFGSKSDVSARYLEKMVAQEGSPIHFLMSPYDYVNSLCPGASNDDSKTKGPPRRVLLSLPLEDRFKTWLLEGPPIHRFDALKHLAPDDSTEDVLGVLHKLAQLVQGLWVPKSSLLYGRDGGVEALARDYILLLFSKNPVINNTRLPPQSQLGKAIKSVLNILAVERPSFNDWKFKEPQDMSFIKLHPNIVDEQEQAWGRLDKAITDLIFGGRNRPGVKGSSKPNLAERPVTLKNSNKGASKNLNERPSRMPMSDETREALPKALQKLFQTYKVCSFHQICQRLREMAVSEAARPKGGSREAIAAANGVDAPPEELLTIISQVAINIHDVFVLKSSPDHPQYDEFRKVVIDLFIAEGRNAKLKKAAIVEAAKMRLNREITPNEYQKVLGELCVSQGSAWVLKSGDGNPK